MKLYATRDDLGEGVFRYTGKFDLRDLRGLTMVPRMGEVPDGYQRPLSKKDVREIADLLKTSASPSIKGLIHYVVPQGANPEWVRERRTLEFHPTAEALLENLDGQHRTSGGFLFLEELGEQAPQLSIQVALYTGLNRIEAAKLFHEIHAKQRPVSRDHLAEIEHLTGMEPPDVLEASLLFDRLLSGVLKVAEGKQPKVKRPPFIKAAVPICGSARLKKLTRDQRVRFLEEYFEAMGEAVQAEIYKGAVLQAACDIFEVVSLQARQTEPKTKQEWRQAFNRTLQPLMGFSLKKLEKRGRAAVADHFREIVGTQIDTVEVEE
jgi:hypothetical protein